MMELIDDSDYLGPILSFVVGTITFHKKGFLNIHPKNIYKYSSKEPPKQNFQNIFILVEAKQTQPFGLVVGFSLDFSSLDRFFFEVKLLSPTYYFFSLSNREDYTISFPFPTEKMKVLFNFFLLATFNPISSQLNPLSETHNIKNNTISID